MPKQGKTLRSAAREIIYNIIQFCQREKAAQTPTIDLAKITERVAAMTGISRYTISKIKKECAKNNGVWRTPGKHRKGRPKKSNLDDFTAESCDDEVTAEHWRKACDHVIHLENKYWEQDHVIDNMQDFIINVTGSDSSSSCDDSDSDAGESADLSGIEYLESEFDYESD